MTQAIEKILNDTERIVQHHKELSRLKGENFNIYNILNLRSNEVRTHSSFIAELLNPAGSHLLGSVFLDAFIKAVPKDAIKDHLDITSTKVFVEFYVGAINIKNKTGGRIDILLKDGRGNTISIENKIDAGDQEFQIERYCNFNKEGNKVIYLSKKGDGPSFKSSGELEEDKGFHVIGYNKEIIKWLFTCQSLAYDQPLVRESIKQYRILIQQITDTLGDQEDKELSKIVIENLEEAGILATKYYQVVSKLKTSFRNRVLIILQETLPGFKITKQPINKKHSNIWFFNKELEVNKKVWFGVESFSGNGHKSGLLFIGIFDEHNNIFQRKEFIPISKQWIHHQPIYYNNKEINTSQTTFLNLISKTENLEEGAQEAAKQIKDFIEEHRFILENK
jgi:hypothetical protein